MAVTLATTAAVPMAMISRRRQEVLAGWAELGSDELLLTQALARHLRAKACQQVPMQSSQQRHGVAFTVRGLLLRWKVRTTTQMPCPMPSVEPPCLVLARRGKQAAHEQASRQGTARSAIDT